MVFRDSIALEGAGLSILAHEIRFEHGAAITLLPGTKDEQRNLRFAADIVRFNGSAKRPFDISLTLSRKVKVSATIVELEGGTNADDFWKRFVDSLDDPSPFSAGDVNIGSSATQLINDTYVQEMSWPLYFAAKLRKHYSRAPFSQDTRLELSPILDANLAVMSRWRDPSPYATLIGIQAAIRNDTDLSGRNIAYTPKEDLLSQKSEIDKVIREAPFDGLITIISETTADGPSKQAQEDKVRNEIETLGVAQKKLESAIDEGTRQSKISQQTLQGLDHEIEVRADDLRRQAEEDAAALRKAQGIKTWATIGASAVVIAASFGAATPAVAAGAAAGISVTGDLIYRHNANESIDIPQLIKLGADTYAQVDAFQKAWDDFRKNERLTERVYSGEKVLEGDPPPAGKPDPRTAVSKVEATKRLLSSAADAAGKAKSIGDNQVAAPKQLSLSEFEDGDSEMRRLLAARASVSEQIGLFAAEVKAKTADLEMLLANTAQLIALDEQLRGAIPLNDQENARWRAYAYLLWAANVQRLSDMLFLYKKSLYFETGRSPDGVPAVLDYPNELVSKVALGILDPLGGQNQEGTKDEIAKRLRLERDKFLESVKASNTAIGSTFHAYLESRAQADVFRRSVSFSIGKGSDNERAFIKALNGQIRQQIVGGTKPEDLLPAFIPFQLPPSTVRYPERLIKGVVINATFASSNASIGSNAIQFQLIHPQYGVMRQGNICYVADLRSTASDWRSFMTPLEAVNPGWTKNEPTAVSVSDKDTGRFYAYLPARAPYSMVIQVISDNWKTVPELQSLEIGFEVMQ